MDEVKFKHGFLFN